MSRREERRRRLAPGPARWFAPDPETCEEHEYDSPLGDSAQLKVRMLLDQTDRLVDFAIMQQYRTSGGWTLVARVDCCHSDVHLHVFAKHGGELRLEVLRPICEQTDVEMGYDDGHDLIVAKWEEHLRRWSRGR